MDYPSEYRAKIEVLRDALEWIRRRATANSGDDLKELQRQMHHIESLATEALKQ